MTGILTTYRASSLDALRGIAIFGMILSGTVASGLLPAWMYHAQVGPRSQFVFDPSIYGITWVDLVFPFFLFAMGASFPFSIGRKLEKGIPWYRLISSNLLRGGRLVFFAIFIQHMYPWIIANPENPKSWAISLFAFLLMFPMYMRMPEKFPRWLRLLLECTAYCVGVLLLLAIPYADGRSFSLSFSNIIILVLANMAVFGAVIYMITWRNKWYRMAVLPFIMGLLLSSGTEGSWANEFINASPLPWMCNFYFLKYLFIVIPGSIAGEYLKERLSSPTPSSGLHVSTAHKLPVILCISLSILILNVYALYARQLVLNLAGSALMLFLLYYLLKKEIEPDFKYWRKLLGMGAYLLLLGLFFEAFEGGIRKDHSTYSYYFVTSGLAFITLIALSIVCDIYRWQTIVKPFEMAGQNPMIAYVAPQLVVMPLVGLLGGSDYLCFFNQNAWLGFTKGMVVTTFSMGIAAFFTYKKCFWRT